MKQKPFSKRGRVPYNRYKANKIKGNQVYRFEDKNNSNNNSTMDIDSYGISKSRSICDVSDIHSYNYDHVEYDTIFNFLQNDRDKHDAAEAQICCFRV